MEIDFTKPTHEEIKAHAKALLDWLRSEPMHPGDLLAQRLGSIIRAELTEAEILYAEAKRLHLENERLRAQSAAGVLNYPPGVRSTAGIPAGDGFNKLMPFKPVEIPDQSVDPHDPRCTLLGGYHRADANNGEAGQ